MGHKATWEYTGTPGELFQIFVNYEADFENASDVSYEVIGAVPVGNTTLSKTTMDQRYMSGELVHDSKPWHSLGWFKLDTQGDNMVDIELEREFASKGRLVTGNIMIGTDHDFATPEGSIGTLTNEVARFDAHEYTESAHDFVLKQKDRSEYIYNSDGNLIAHFDRNGNQTRYYYTDTDNNGRSTELSRIMRQGGSFTDFVYTVADANGHGAGFLDVINQTVHQAVGSPVLTTDITISNSQLMRAHLPATGADSDGNAFTESFQPDYVFNYDDSLITVTEVTGTNSANVWKVTDDNGIVKVSYQSPGAALLETYSVDYVSEDNLLAPRVDLDPTNRIKSDVKFDQVAGRAPYHYQTDRFGLVVTVSAPPTLSTPQRDLWKYERDNIGLLTTLTEPAGGQGAFNGTSFNVHNEIASNYVYDSKANLKEITAPDAGTQKWEYDPTHNTVSLFEDALGRRTVSTNFTANGNAELVIEEDNLGNTGDYGLSNGGVRHTTYTYTSQPAGINDLPGGMILDIVVAANSADIVSQQTRYFANGKDTGLIQFVKTAANTTDEIAVNYSYDNYLNLATVDSPSPQTNGARNTTTFVYDHLGRLLESNLNSVQAGVARTSYQYDGAGNLIAVQDPRGFETHTTYDALHRQVAVKSPEYTYTVPFQNETHNVKPISRFSYVGSNIVAVTSPNGSVIEYNYDDRQQLERTTLPAASNARISPEYPTAVADLDANRYQHFRYDVHGNITSQVFDYEGSDVARSNSGI